jgi:hypothetical protein
MHFMGIDLGTGTISAVAYDFSTKKSDTVTRQNAAALLSSATWEKPHLRFLSLGIKTIKD